MLTYEVVVQCLQCCCSGLLTPHAHKAKALALAAVPVTHHNHLKHLEAASTGVSRSGHAGQMLSWHGAVPPRQLDADQT